MPTRASSPRVPPLPRPGSRITFRGDPVVFEYYSGRGLAIQPLASFGKATRVDVAQKRQSTAGFLAKAKAETAARFDEWQAEFWATNASLGDAVDMEES